MAEELQNRKRNIITGETWEKAFEGVDKTSKAFHGLVDEFTDWVSKYHEFTDFQEEQFVDYLENLDSIQNHWKDINKWVEVNSRTIDTYAGSLSTIQSALQSIVDETGGFTRRTNDGINLFRQLNRLASDGISITQQEGGISESALKSLDRRRVKLDTIYKSHLRQLGVLNAEGEIDEDLAQQQLDRSNDQIQRDRARLAELNRLRESGVRIDNRQLRYLENQIRYHEVIMELVGKETKLVKDSLDDQLVRQKELFRMQSKGRGPVEDLGRNAFGDRKVNIVSKVLKKLQFQEEAEELQRAHGEWKTNRVTARQALDIEGKRKDEAAEKAELAKQQYKNLVNRNHEVVQKRASSIDAKKANLADLLEEQKKQEKIFQTGRQKGGQFASWLDRDTAFNRYGELGKQIKKLRGEINELTEDQNRFFREVESARVGYKNLTREAQDAEESYKKVADNWEQVQNIKFDAVIKEKLKGVFADLSGFLAYVGGLLAVAVWRQLLKIDEEAVKTKRVIGQWADASALANTKFVSGTEVLKTMRDLGEQFHINPVQVFSTQELARISHLAVQSKITGKNADTYRDSIADGAYQSRLVNKQAISLSAVQNDVLTTSRAIALSYGNNVEGLARAAGAAAALGTNLQGVEEIAKNLMNFESSIESEMQAQLLTGMQLNLAKAREYALNNDLEGVAKEVGRQGMDAAKFSHMNYIQQENMAKALGMSREQMSKMLIMQEISKGLSAEEIANRTGMKRQDIEALSAQEKWQTMKQRFLESLVPLLEPVLQVTSDIFRLITPLLGIISTIAGWISRIFNIIPENWVYLRGLVGIIAIAIPAALLRGVSIVGLLKNGFTGIVKVSQTIAGAIGSWTKNLLGANKAGQATQAVFDKVANRWRDTKTGRFVQTPKEKGGFFSRIFGRTKDVPAPDPKAAEGTSKLGGSVSSLGKNMGNILKGAAALLIIAGALYVTAKAVQEFKKVSGKDMVKAGAALVVLGGAAYLAGKLLSSSAPEILIASIALAVFGTALIPVAFALRLAAPAFEAFASIVVAVGSAIKSALEGLATVLTATFAGLGTLLENVTLEKAAALIALGGGFGILGAGLIAGTAGLLLFPVGKFARLTQSLSVLGQTTGLSQVASDLELVGTALGSVAENLDKVDVRKFRRLVTASTLGNLGNALASRIAKPQEPITPKAETLGESKENPRENIEAAVQNIVIKQAEIRASAQRISVEQKAADLSKIEKKLDNVITAIKSATPTDWNWLEFNRTQTVNA